MHHLSKNRLALLTILFTIFLDLLGVGIIQPTLPVLFEAGGTFADQVGLGATNILYGFLIAAYPISQLFGTPFLGFLSDIYGRKKILMLSVIGTIMGLLIFAVGVAWQNLFLLFLGRAIDGFTGGNIFIVQSIIADISTKSKQTRNFGYINIALGLGLVFGPLFGGILTTVNLFGSSNLITPYIFAGMLGLINLIFIMFVLEESTIIDQIQKLQKKSEIHWLMSFQQVNRAFKIKKLQLYFTLSFLSALTFSLFSLFFPKYLTDKFDFNSYNIGIISAYTGFWLAVVVALVLPYLSKQATSQTVLQFGLLGTGLSLILTLIPSDPIWFYLLLPIVAGLMGVTTPNLTTLLVEEVEVEKQGEMLGINQSIQALATTAPLLAGFAVNLWDKLPIFSAALASILAWVIYRFQLDSKVRADLQKELN